MTPIDFQVKGQGHGDSNTVKWNPDDNSRKLKPRIMKLHSSFRIKTAKARRYETPDDVTKEMRPTETDSSHTTLDSSRISRIVVRNHEFDIRTSHKIGYDKTSGTVPVVNQ
ncbi:hypothetical protein DPMN_094381 [Dreissena polymorpha]|uniref:Uncharacterized protein n=1 Tax=Dreissena polymorpha TaxID=45954 RepID=A0A9D4R1W7_DREPO|nr:hypothetical protein DPMN_094381 [Dreissena polymorpha]